MSRTGFLVWVLVALAILSACCLLAGFMTPVVGIVIVIVALLCALLGIPLSMQDDANHSLVELIVLALAIVLLGPGAFSLDARMFGRREIRILAPHHSARN